MDTSRKRAQSRGEEIANSVSHGVGLLAAIAAAVVLVLTAARQGGTARIVGASVFSAAMVLLYLTSTLYHALPGNRAKRVFQVLDHAAIFIMIAGTYTPFTLGVLRGAWGWTLFGIVWGLAVIGSLQEIWSWRGPRIVSVLIDGYDPINRDRADTQEAFAAEYSRRGQDRGSGLSLLA